MAVLLVSMDLFALATVPAGPDEAGGPPPTKFYRRRDNVVVGLGPTSGALDAVHRRLVGLAAAFLDVCECEARDEAREL
jgi:hypothetical protein